MNLTEYRRRADRLAAQYDHARQSVRDERAALKSAREHLANVTEAQKILQTVAQAVQQTAHKRIADVVSRCLEAVFDEPYSFKIEFERKRGKTEARLSFVRDGLEIDPLTAAGGGVVDVAAFALRVAALILSRPPLRRLIVLDEPFSHVKPPEVLGPRICEMIQALSQEFGIQFIIVPSIEDHYQIGKVVPIR